MHHFGINPFWGYSLSFLIRYSQAFLSVCLTGSERNLDRNLTPRSGHETLLIWLGQDLGDPGRVRHRVCNGHAGAKRVASELVSHPVLSKLPKYSEEVEHITPPGFSVETNFCIRRMINQPERVEGRSILFCSVQTCNKPSWNRTTLINHIRKEHLNQKLRCLLCQYTCWAMEMLADHGKGAHSHKT